MSAITVTPERAELVDFIEPYYYGSDFALFAPNNTIDVSGGWEGLAGQKVCVFQGGVLNEILERLNIVPVDVYDADADATEKLFLSNIKQKKCIGALSDNVAPSIFKNTLFAVNLPAQSVDPTNPAYLGMAVAKGNEELKKKITEANLEIFKGGAESEILALEKEYMVANGMQPNAALAEMVAQVAAEETSVPSSSGSKPGIFYLSTVASIIIGAAIVGN